MKSTKRFIAVVIALALVMSFGTTVFADTTNELGSITVRNATIGKDYTIYKVFDLTYAEGTENVSYTYTKSGASDALFTALASTPVADSDPVKYEGTPFILTPTTTADVYNVELNPDYFKADDDQGKVIGEFLAGLAAGENPVLTPYGTPITASKDTVEFTDLPYGYYYVKSSLDTVATVDSTLPNVTVLDKNEGPTWDNETPDPDDPDGPAIKNGKVILVADGNGGYNKVKSNEVNFGDTVKFSIAVNATAYVGEDLVTYYYITDTLADGFDGFKNLEVTVDGEEPLVYNVTYSETSKSFRVDIPFGEMYGSNAKIEVTYEATLTDKAAIGTTGNLNTADFAYLVDDEFDPDDPGYTPTPLEPNPDYDPEDPNDEPYTDTPNPNYPKDPTIDDGGTPDDPADDEYIPYEPENPADPDVPGSEDGGKETTKTYTYALGIKKVDEKGNTLAGASFSLKLGETAIKAVPATDEDGEAIPGIYNYSTDTSAVTEFVTDENGYLVIKGLVPGEYSITEEAHPAGYNPLKAPVTTTIVTGASDAANPVLDIPEAAIEEIVNESGVELPSTGGTGTALLIGVGSVLFLAAALVLVTKKRMYNAG